MIRFKTGGGDTDLPPGYVLHTFDRIDSTSNELRRMANGMSAPSGTLVLANEQTSGRGRYGRVWTSPPGNMYLSLLLRPEVSPATAAQLSFVVAVALADVLSSILPSNARLGLKWPNDVLVNGRKLAGILLESEIDSENGVDFVIIGTGVNIVHAPEGAISLQDIRGSGLPVEQLVQLYLFALDTRYKYWLSNGFEKIREDWLAYSCGLGQPICVRLAQEEITGLFYGLDDQGVLLLDTGGHGKMADLRKITAGEVFFTE